MALERGDRLTTYAEYLALPEGHYDLIDGVLLMTPAASPRHQSLVVRLTVALATHVRAQQGGAVWAAPLDVVLREADPALVVQPDVLYVSRGGAARVNRRGVAGPPDLVIEVLSPSNPRLDAVRKRQIYADHGVREYWLVLPDLEQVEVLRQAATGGFARPLLLDRGDTLETPLLPGFALPLAELFAPEEMPAEDA